MTVVNVIDITRPPTGGPYTVVFNVVANDQNTVNAAANAIRG